MALAPMELGGGEQAAGGDALSPEGSEAAPPECDEDWLVLRRRAARLLESLRDIPKVRSDPKAWENDHERVFALFRRGCLDGTGNGMLEAPIYSNRDVEEAWVFLLEMARRHPNRRKHVQECTRALGASYNWCLVLHGSRRLRALLQEVPEAQLRELFSGVELPELLGSPASASTSPTAAATPHWRAAAQPAPQAEVPPPPWAASPAPWAQAATPPAPPRAVDAPGAAWLQDKAESPAAAASAGAAAWTRWDAGTPRQTAPATPTPQASVPGWPSRTNPFGAPSGFPGTPTGGAAAPEHADVRAGDAFSAPFAAAAPFAAVRSSSRGSVCSAASKRPPLVNPFQGAPAPARDNLSYNPFAAKPSWAGGSSPQNARAPSASSSSGSGPGGASPAGGYWGPEARRPRPAVAALVPAF